MANRDDLKEWVLQAVEESDGRARVVRVAKHIWDNHENELRGSGDLFYTWQYEMRWAAQRLREEGRLALSARDWVVKH